jgi:hypothetical protein
MLLAVRLRLSLAEVHPKACPLVKCKEVIRWMCQGFIKQPPITTGPHSGNQPRQPQFSLPCQIKTQDSSVEQLSIRSSIMLGLIILHMEAIAEASLVPWESLLWLFCNSIRTSRVIHHHHRLVKQLQITLRRSPWVQILEVPVLEGPAILVGVQAPSLCKTLLSSNRHLSTRELARLGPMVSRSSILCLS